MIQSRDINDLRSDVATNCRIFIDMCAAKGYKVGLSCTYRDQEYQTYLHNQGKAPATVTFHGAKLAFDIFQNVSGHAYDNDFFDAVALIAKQIGFSWMWDIAKNEKCHFQWDDNRNYHDSDIKIGKMPPAMPLYKTVKEEEDNMSYDDFKVYFDRYITEIGAKAPSEWSEKAREYAESNGIINGDENGDKKYKKFVTREELAQIIYNMANS